MNRRSFLKNAAQTAIVGFTPRSLFAKKSFRRRRPSDANWPSQAAWKRLHDEVDGKLIPVEFPLAPCIADVDGAGCKSLLTDVEIHNPYYIGDQPGLTQTLGWVDAWWTKPSAYAIAADNAQHLAAAVNFARENDLRLVVKGGGHSYLGTSNAPDSLLAWTRHMHDVTMHEKFVPQGCEKTQQPLRAVSCGSGAIWMQAYTTVTTKNGGYVQGGGCTTVGVAGLVQSGGFGSFSKHYGSSAGSLLEAEVITADGKIRTVNACNDPDLFWALKGGGGGTFGVVSNLTLRVHELPEFMGGVIQTITATSDDAFRRLIRYFVDFYHDQLFNHRWGEQIFISSANRLGVRMVSHGVSADDAKKIWQPFLDWVNGQRGAYSFTGDRLIASIPAQRWWDVEWSSKNLPGRFVSDARPGADANNVWWSGDAGQVAQTLYGYESLWLPASLLEAGSRERLAGALFAGSRYQGIGMHFNKGLAGAPPEAIERSRDTATNPAALNAFCLVIVADGGGGYPGIKGHLPDVAAARESRKKIHQCVNELRDIGGTGAYVSESNFFEEDFQHAYWGSNYARLASVKKKYDPDGLFFVHNGVGSEQWSKDGFVKL